MRYLIIIVSIVTATLAVAEMRPRPVKWAQPMMDSRMENFYKVDDDLYRSEQPSGKGVKELERYGIRSILNLRNRHSDKEEARKASMTLYTIPMEAGEMTDDSMEKAMLVIARAEKPMLVHCWHGSDRTGAVIAMYRMVFQGWTRAEAIDELINGGYGYHKNLYPNITGYLTDVDLSRFKKALKGAGALEIKQKSPAARR